jgi:hypothetical protein
MIRGERRILGDQTHQYPFLDHTKSTWNLKIMLIPIIEDFSYSIFPQHL